MVVKVMDVIAAEGSELECALFTYALIEIFRHRFEKEEKDKVHMEAELLEKLGNMTFEELWKMERGEEE